MSHVCDLKIIRVNTVYGHNTVDHHSLFTAVCGNALRVAVN